MKPCEHGRQYFLHAFNYLLDYLLDQNADLEAKNDMGFTALSWAAMGASDVSKDFDPSLLTTLIDAGADLSVIELVIMHGQYLATVKVSKELEEYNKENPGMKRKMRSGWIEVAPEICTSR